MELLRIAIAIAGILSVYLGYRLFCDSVDAHARVRHLLSGALLAAFGLAILFADARGAGDALRASNPLAKSAAHKGSVATPRRGQRDGIALRLI